MAFSFPGRVARSERLGTESGQHGVRLIESHLDPFPERDTRCVLPANTAQLGVLISRGPICSSPKAGWGEAPLVRTDENRNSRTETQRTA